MGTVVYVGDALGAAGFRLAGVTTLIATAGNEIETVTRARRGAALVLVATTVAAALPQEQLHAWESALEPLLLQLPDLASGQHPPDRLAGVLGQLGVET